MIINSITKKNINDYVYVKQGHRSQNLWTHSLTHVTNSCPRHNSHIVHNKVVNSSQTIVVSCYIRGVTPPGRVFGSVHLGKKKERRIILLLDHARLEYSFKALGCLKRLKPNL